MNTKETIIKKLLPAKRPQKEDIEKSFTFKDVNLPTHIYRYTNLNKIERVINDLERQRIHITKPTEFNDPYDSMCKINLLSLTINSNQTHKFTYVKRYNSSFNNISLCKKNIISPVWLYSFQSNKNQKNQKIISGLNNFRHCMKVACFTENPGSVLMWAHYTGNHTGICIEYDISEVEKSNNFRRDLYPVIYNRQISDLTAIFSLSIEGAPYNNLFPIKSAVYKNPEWQYEQEWRIIMHNFKSEYISTPKPKRILLGTKISNENEDMIRSFCRNRGIDVFKVKHSKYKHEIITS